MILWLHWQIFVLVLNTNSLHFNNFLFSHCSSSAVNASWFKDVLDVCVLENETETLRRNIMCAVCDSSVQPLCSRFAVLCVCVCVCVCRYAVRCGGEAVGIFNLEILLWSVLEQPSTQLSTAPVVYTVCVCVCVWVVLQEVCFVRFEHVHCFSLWMKHVHQNYIFPWEMFISVYLECNSTPSPHLLCSAEQMSPAIKAYYTHKLL